MENESEGGGEDGLGAGEELKPQDPLLYLLTLKLTKQNQGGRGGRGLGADSLLCSQGKLMGRSGRVGVVSPI